MRSSVASPSLFYSLITNHQITNASHLHLQTPIFKNITELLSTRSFSLRERSTSSPAALRPHNVYRIMDPCFYQEASELIPMPNSHPSSSSRSLEPTPLSLSPLVLNLYKRHNIDKSRLASLQPRNSERHRVLKSTPSSGGWAVDETRRFGGSREWMSSWQNKNKDRTRVDIIVAE